MRAVLLLLVLLLVAPRSSSATADEPVLQPGQPVDYARLAFQPETWKKKSTSTLLTPWSGKRVVFLTVQGDYDPALITRWVRALDDGWALYARLTGAQPGLLKQLDGKATIAAVPGFEYTCGAGCGYVGATGIELAMFYDWNYPALRKNPKAIPHYVFYEMGRNFYTFGDRHSCFTTGFAVFMRYVCMDALELHDDDLPTRKVIEAAERLVASDHMPFLRTFTNADGLDEKAPRLKDKNGGWLSPSDQPVTYASAMLRLRRDYGGDDWVRRFFAALAACPGSPSNTREGALQQSWHWFLCASIAAGRDLSPLFCDQWRFPLAASTRQALSKVDWKSASSRGADLVQNLKPEWKPE